MIKAETTELKKLFTIKNCHIGKICGCYVDGDKNKKATFSHNFFALPEEEQFKYFEIFRKVLSGTMGKNCVDMEFSLDAEAPDSPHAFLMQLRADELKSEDLLEDFYNRVISSYEYVGNYLILLIHDSYDIPSKGTDNLEMEDASDDIYNYLMVAICPVELTDPGLSYDPVSNSFHNRVRDWVVELPVNGFLFPAFTDRQTDIHSALYYSKDPENYNGLFVDTVLGCEQPMTAGGQKETFQTIVEQTLGEECQFETVKVLHEKMNEFVEEHKEENVPLVLERHDVRNLLESTGAPNDRMEIFDEQYEMASGSSAKPILVSNVLNSRSFDIKMPDVVIKVKPDRTDLIENKPVDGHPCLVVRLNGEVEVNGITVRAGGHPDMSEEE